MTRTAKRQAEIDAIMAQLIKTGDWQCRYCSNKNWTFYIGKDKTECPVCHRSKSECENDSK